MSIYNAIAQGSNIGAGINAFAQNRYMVQQDQKAEAERQQQNAFAQQQNQADTMRQIFMDAVQLGPEAGYAYTVDMAKRFNLPMPDEQYRGILAQASERMAGQGSGYSKSPVWLTDENGNAVAAQLSDSGGLNVVPPPTGMRYAPSNLIPINQGGQIVLAEPRTGAPQATYDVGLRPGEQPQVRYDQAAAAAQAGVDVREIDPAAQADREAQRIANERAAAQAETERTQIEGAKQTKADLVALASEILSAGDYKSVYGTIQGAIPDIRQSSVDASAKVKRLVDLLTLENTSKMTGVLSESDIKILANAGSILANPRISDEAAEQELTRIANILGVEIPAKPAAGRGVRQKEKKIGGATITFED